MADTEENALKSQEGSNYGSANTTASPEEGLEPEISDVVEDFGVRWIHIWLIWIQWLVGITGGAVVSSARLGLEDVRSDYGVSHAMATWVSGGVTMGAMAGVVIFGWLNDAIGRKTCIVVQALSIGLLCLFHLVLPVGHSGIKFGVLVLLRVAIGIPYGGLAAMAYLHILEFCPSSIRGTICCVSSIGWSIGHMLINFFSYELEDNWQLLLTTPTLFCALLLLALYFTPESPRWLIVAGRLEDGKEVMNKIFRSPNLCELSRPPVFTKAPKVMRVMDDHDQQVDQTWVKRMSACLRPRLRLTLGCCVLALFLCNACCWGYSVWNPDILKELTGSGQIPYDILNMGEVGQLLGTFFSAIWLDRAGRRLTLFLSFLCSGILLMILPHCRDKYALIGFVHFTVNFSTSNMWSAITVYMAEALPTDVRATGCSIAWLCARIAATIMPILTGWVLDGSGLLGAGPITSALNVNAYIALAGTLVALAIPHEMANVKMEDSSASPRPDKKLSRCDLTTPRRREMV